MTKRDDNFDESDVIRYKFDDEFFPGHQRDNRFGITGSGSRCGDFYDDKTKTSYPIVEVYVMSEGGKNLLAAELQKRDRSRDFCYFEGAKINIIVTGEIDALKVAEDRGAFSDFLLSEEARDHLSVELERLRKESPEVFE